jgi:hypothetical protein
MKARLMLALLCCLALATPVAAQAPPTRPTTLATLFGSIFGPSGLIVSSDEVLVDGTTHAAHFNSAFQSDFRLVNIALTTQLASVPLPSPASGFTYQFDPATGTFARSARSFGPILADRGETIGRGRLAVGFSYQFFSFDRLDGVNLSSVPAVFTHDDHELGGGRADVVATRNSIRANVSQMAAALTVGVTDRFDLALAVPVISTQLSLISNARIVRVGTGTDSTVHYFRTEDGLDGRGDTKQFYAEGSATGIGDLLLRAKGTLVKRGASAPALGVDARLPTGDEENLLGAGAPGLRAFGAFSTQAGRFAPHVNVAYQWNGRSVLAGAPEDHADQTHSHDHGRGLTHGVHLPDHVLVAVGTDYSISDRLSVVVDMVGRRVMRSPRLSVYDFRAAGPAGEAVISDIRFDTASYWVQNSAVGFKANVATGLLMNFNLRFHLNGGGLSDRVAPLLGIEWGF